MRFLAFCLAASTVALAAVQLLSPSASAARQPAPVPDVPVRRRVRFPVAFSVN
jgi:hypothetical protein